MTQRLAPHRLAPLPALLCALALTGCGLSTGSQGTTTAPIATVRPTGSVHGGQQAVSGSTIQFYEAGNTGYFTTARPMLSPAATTDASGNFWVSQSYTCTAGDQLYVTSTGGNPGLTAGTNNTALALMAPLGECSYVLNNRASILLNINEVTTIATAWSLARFMSSPTTAGTSSSNAAGLANAFANIVNVVNVPNGSVPGPTLPAGATLPTAEINTLANILATCVNSDGDLSTGSPCMRLFAAATPPGGATPGDTITAALNIARYPARNVSALYVLPSPAAPFQPSLMATPNNWLIGIHFTGGGLSQPAALAVDASGNVWTANAGNNSVSLFTPTGAAISPATGFTDPSLASPSAIAIDTSGNAWAANSAGSSVTAFNSSGTVTGTLATNLSHPSGVAFDGAGDAWVLSPGTGTLVKFDPSQNFLLQQTLTTVPTAIAINPN
jgi:hypothetical protein